MSFVHRLFWEHLFCCGSGSFIDDVHTHFCCVYCRQGRAATDEEKTALGPCAPLPILWDDTHCDVTATSLFECQRKQGPGNCQRDEDVFVVCSGIAATPPPQTSTTTTTAATTTTRSFGKCGTTFRQLIVFLWEEGRGEKTLLL